VVSALALVALIAEGNNPPVIARHTVAGDVVRCAGRWVAAAYARKALHAGHMGQPGLSIGRRKIGCALGRNLAHSLAWGLWFLFAL
jgi:hypothetical protein